MIRVFVQRVVRRFFQVYGIYHKVLSYVKDISRAVSERNASQFDFFKYLTTIPDFYPEIDKATFHRSMLQSQLDDISIVQHMIPLDHLSVKHGLTPHSGHF